MTDFTSALYLGLRHGSAAVPPWAELTTGVPAALADAPRAGPVAAGLARLIGVPDATVATSTLHAFWDLFVALGARRIFVDAGAYPIARWGAERAHGRGAAVRTFRHHDPAALHRAVTAGPGRGPGPVIVTDGLCPGCGGVAPLADYLDVIRGRQGIVVVDDTQALGVLGTPAPGRPYGTGGGGTARWAELDDPRLLVVASLAKGLGVPLAVVAGSGAALRRYVAGAETRVHCSPPSNAHLNAAAHALACNAADGDARRGHLVSLVGRFRGRLHEEGIPLMPGLFPVQTIPPQPHRDLRDVHRRLAALGVKGVLHQRRCQPGLALSFLFTAAHQPAEVDRAARAVCAAVGERGGRDLRLAAGE